MPYSHPKISAYKGGWYVVMKDGSVFTQDDCPWTELQNKRDIDIMGLKWRNKAIEISGKENYIPPGETCFREIGFVEPGQLRVTPQELYERYIGYYAADGKVYCRINVNTGEYREEKIPY